MRKILCLLIANTTLCGCNILGPSKGSNDTAKPAPLPPNQITKETVNLKTSSSQPIVIEKNNYQENNSVERKPRIQEERSIGGTVKQIKVNNKNLPDYYIYPSPQQNFDNNTPPNKNITTPSWQINW
ncbi:MAG TPA: hypothetical protein PKD00_06985 [Burkholderiales bacterium]|nr:hypothetical protein [Burkholderiales bacterium]